MAGLNPTLEELRGLIRATHLFARNYKATAPSITADRRAIDSAFLILEEALIDAMRKGVARYYDAGRTQQEKFVQAEVDRLVVSADTPETVAEKCKAARGALDAFTKVFK